MRFQLFQHLDMDAEDREGRGWKNNLHCQTPKTQFENKLLTTAVYFFDPDESISAKREVGMQAKKGKRTCLLSTSSLAKHTIHGLLKEYRTMMQRIKCFTRRFLRIGLRQFVQESL